MPAEFVYPVLAIEDHPADMRLLEEAFRECQPRCELTIVRSFVEAQQLLAARRFALVLSDWGADPTEALAFLRALRSHQHLRSLPVIVLSGSSQIEQAYAAGANAFVTKRAELDEFLASMQSLVRFWMQTAELPAGKGASA